MALREVDTPAASDKDTEAAEAAPVAAANEGPKATPIAEAKDRPKTTPIAEAKDRPKTTPIAEAPKPAAAKPRGGRGWKVLSFVLALLLLAAVGVIGHQAQITTQLTGEVSALEASLVESQSEVQGFEQQIGQVHEGLVSLAAQVTALTEITSPSGDAAAQVDDAPAEATAIDGSDDATAEADAAAVESSAIDGGEASAAETVAGSDWPAEAANETGDDAGVAASDVTDPVGATVATERLMDQLGAVASDAPIESAGEGDVASPGESFRTWVDSASGWASESSEGVRDSLSRE